MYKNWKLLIRNWSRKIPNTYNAYEILLGYKKEVKNIDYYRNISDNLCKHDTIC